MLILALASIVQSKQIICSIESGNVVVVNNLVTCVSRDGRSISESVTNQELYVVQSTEANEISVSASTVNMTLIDSTIKGSKPILVDDNSIATINFAGSNFIEGSEFGIGCERNSIVRLQGIRQHDLALRGRFGPGFGSKRNDCKSLEMNLIDAQVLQIYRGANDTKRACAIGSGKVGDDYSHIEQIVINNSKVYAQVANSYYSGIGGKVDEILILNSSVESRP